VKRLKTAAALMCLATLGWQPVCSAQTVYAVTGDGSTNSLDQSTTLGSVQLRLRASTGEVLKFECGLLGQRQSVNADGSLAFRHMVACNDHSLFVLMTRTEITVQNACVGRPGVVGTFRETSVIQGVDGPFAGSSGEVAIKGTINCGFNDMEIKGSLTRP
jgi:hypothetical protein